MKDEPMNEVENLARIVQLMEVVRFCKEEITKLKSMRIK